MKTTLELETLSAEETEEKLEASRIQAATDAKEEVIVLEESDSIENTSIAIPSTNSPQEAKDTVLYGETSIDPEDYVLPEISSNKKEIRSAHFEFGTPDTHLIFSEPVIIDYSVPFPDGTKIAIEALHAGDTAFGSK